MNPIFDREPFEQTMTAMMIQSSPLSQTYLFYAAMILQCGLVFDTQMQAPASVHFDIDHYVLSINPTLFNEFTLEERCGVLTHEMSHILNGHLIRFEDRENFKKWNYATDCAINQFIQHLPQGCINPTNLPVKKGVKVPAKVNSEQYYDIIDDDQLPPDNGDGSGNGDGNPLDDHSGWNKSKGQNETLQKDIAKGMMDKAANETQKGRGNLPSAFSDWLEINTSSNQISWQRVLRNLAGNKRVNTRRTIMRSDRRFPGREEIKGKTKDRMFNLAVIADVSGSVSDKELAVLLGEIKQICVMTNSNVKLVQVDTKPYPPEDLKKHSLTFHRKACGGTTLNPAIDMLKQHKIPFDALVVTTDGGLCSSDVNAFIGAAKKVIWLVSQDCIMSEMTQNGMEAYRVTVD